MSFDSSMTMGETLCAFVARYWDQRALAAFLALSERCFLVVLLRISSLMRLPIRRRRSSLVLPLRAILVR